MKTTKKIFSRVMVLMTVCILAILACSAAFADGESMTVKGEYRNVYWRTNGNGEEVSIFQVVVNRAPATVRFTQNEGLCYENSYTHYFDGKDGLEEEWGKYHVYYKRLEGGSIGRDDWDKTRRGADFEIYLNNTGTYVVWVVPYTAQEMTDSWTLDTFNRWNKAPYWWVSYASNNCMVTNSSYRYQKNANSPSEYLNMRDFVTQSW